MTAKMRHIITKFQNIEDEEKSFISFQKEGEKLLVKNQISWHHQKLKGSGTIPSHFYENIFSHLDFYT